MAPLNPRSLSDEELVGALVWAAGMQVTFSSPYLNEFRQEAARRIPKSDWALIDSLIASAKIMALWAESPELSGGREQLLDKMKARCE